MSKRRNNHAGTRAVAYALVLLGATGLGALAFYVQNTPEAARVAEPLLRPEPRTERPAPIVEQPQPEPERVTVRIPTLKGDEPFLDSTLTLPPGQDPMLEATRATLEAASVSAKVLGVEVVERVARLSLTPEIEGGMGSMQEGQTIKALQLTLGQFKGVDSFQLFVEGRQVESLGHLELEPNIPVIR